LAVELGALTALLTGLVAFENIRYAAQREELRHGTEAPPAWRPDRLLDNQPELLARTTAAGRLQRRHRPCQACVDQRGQHPAGLRGVIASPSATVSASTTTGSPSCSDSTSMIRRSVSAAFDQPDGGSLDTGWSEGPDSATALPFGRTR
jgi:hypothetical protein